MKYAFIALLAAVMLVGLAPAAVEGEPPDRDRVVGTLTLLNEPQWGDPLTFHVVLNKAAKLPIIAIWCYQHHNPWSKTGQCLVPEYRNYLDAEVPCGGAITPSYFDPSLHMDCSAVVFEERANAQPVYALTEWIDFTVQPLLVQ